MASSTTYVLVHGAWQSRIAYDGVVLKMQEMGAPVMAIDLPGHSENAYDLSRITLNTYIDYVLGVLESIQGDIVLVGHSMGGMVISAVAERFPVKRLVYIAAFLPQTGESLLKIAEQFPESGLASSMVFDIEKNAISLKHEGLQAVLYNDCDADVASDAISTLQIQPAMPFNGVVNLGVQFEKTHKCYIVCLRDKAISPDAQRSMAARAGCDVVELDAGHEPMISAADRLAALLVHPY